MKKIIISAVSLNNVIGTDEVLPWNNKEELNYFKETTLNHVVLMGRKTFESIKKVLPERTNLVVSRRERENNKKNNLFFFQSIENAIKYAESLNAKKLFIIGGSELYLQTINEVDEILISRIPLKVNGNKYFPEINKEIWKIAETIEHGSFTSERYLKIV